MTIGLKRDGGGDEEEKTTVRSVPDGSDKDTNLEPLTAILTSKEVTMTIENLWTPLLKVMAEENEDTEEHCEGDGDDHQQARVYHS